MAMDWASFGLGALAGIALAINAVVVAERWWRGPAPGRGEPGAGGGA